MTQTTNEQRIKEIIELVERIDNVNALSVQKPTLLKMLQELTTPEQAEPICVFESDPKATSATKCVKCGCEKWAHEPLRPHTEIMKEDVEQAEPKQSEPVKVPTIDDINKRAAEYNKMFSDRNTNLFLAFSNGATWYKSQCEPR